MSFKITAPLGRLYELPELLAAGADEIYCGLSLSHDGKISSYSRRALPAHNLQSLEELEAAADLCHRCGKHLFLAMNEAHYAADVLPNVLETIETAVRAGIDAVITADIYLNYKLIERYLPVDFFLSTMAAVFSKQNLAFWKKRNIKRVILPRQLGIEEIVELSRADMEFEIPVLNGACRFEEGICGFEHLLPLYSPEVTFGGCNKDFKIETRSFGDSGLTEISLQDMQTRLQHRFGNVRGKKGPRTCGLCILPHLKDTNVCSLKIVGREAATCEKIKDISFCKKTIALYSETTDIEKFYQGTREEYFKHFKKACSRSDCYYISQKPGSG